MKLIFLIFLVCISVGQIANSKEILKYNRDLFGGWSDTDRDCQNTRHELLQKLSTAVISLSKNSCRVTRGRWLDLYTDKIFLESKHLDLDHLVPLKYAWDRGSHSWSSLKRVQFSNDPSNLFAVQKSVNRQKSAFGPTEWLPPNLEFRCQYILRFQRIVKKYGLEQGATELRLIQKARRQHCR